VSVFLRFLWREKCECFCLSVCSFVWVYVFFFFCLIKKEGISRQKKREKKEGIWEKKERENLAPNWIWEIGMCDFSQRFCKFISNGFMRVA
jgi:hypothetical protein